MKHARFTTSLFAIATFMSLSAGVPVVAEQSRDQDRAAQYGGSSDPWQHGYEHAYRDGADQGRQDREQKRPYSWRNNDYWGARGYERAFGDQNQYMDGYRQGYQAGYDDGYYGLPGQYGQVYARPPASGRPPSRDDVYANRGYSATDMAFDAGYREGINVGQQDSGRRSRSNYRNSDAYKNADLGYRSNYGNRDDYRTQYRDGFERGYEDGYGRSPERGSSYGRADVGPRGAQGSGGGTFIVPANRQWTPTGIRVRQGETLRFSSSGEIRFTGNAADRAGVAGSPAHKFVGGAPLPSALAGALIGRIDNGVPFGIGDQSTITAPASGLLYLGTNDDNVSDNSGQFQVIISTGR